MIMKQWHKNVDKTCKMWQVMMFVLNYALRLTEQPVRCGYTQNDHQLVSEVQDMWSPRDQP